MNIVRNYFKILWRFKYSIGMYFAIFLGISIFYSITVRVTDEGANSLQYQSYYRIGIVNRAPSDPVTRGLVQYLTDTYRQADVPDDPKAMKDAVASGVADYVLLVEKDGSLRYYGRSEDGSAIGINMKINEYMDNAGIWRDLTQESDLKPVIDILKKDAPVKVLGKEAAVDAGTHQLKAYFLYSTYPMLMMMMYGVYNGYKNFNKELIVQRLNITRHPRHRMMMQLIFASIGFVGIVWFLFFISGAFMFRGTLFTPVGWSMLLSSLVFLIPATALGFLINAFVTRDAAATAASNAIALALSFISGTFIPQELLSDGLLRVASLFPPYWMIRSLDAIVEHDGRFSPELWQSFGIQILIACAFIAVILLLGRARPVKTVGTTEEPAR